MAKKSFSVEKLIIQLSLGLLLAVGGIWGLQGGGDFGINSLKSVFSGSAENIAVIVFSIIELLAGIYLVLELFIGSLGKFKSILMLIIMIVWIVAFVLSVFMASVPSVLCTGCAALRVPGAFFYDSNASRTRDLPLRRRMLYPAELRRHICLGRALFILSGILGSVKKNRHIF